MNRFLLSLFLSAILAAGLLVNTAYARVSVRSYYRSTGTYVAPHYRSDPDSFRSNNWSSWGNYNPYTGKKGYRRW